jgi:hypothetical protein
MRSGGAGRSMTVMSGVPGLHDPAGPILANPFPVPGTPAGPRPPTLSNAATA